MIGKKQQAVLKALYLGQESPYKTDIVLAGLVQKALVWIKRNPSTFRIEKVELTEYGRSYVRVSLEKGNL